MACTSDLRSLEFVFCYFSFSPFDSGRRAALLGGFGRWCFEHGGGLLHFFERDDGYDTYDIGL